ncbi:RNA polymerase III subunit C82 [Sporothrix stenoceras]|uniref:DNA-directed RNA polymerase III subunit RPC3 n=1 Tax=Sporothrix stenoceras TaxID=5173 RepID=A0ABR3YMS7_9PEZI
MLLVTKNLAELCTLVIDDIYGELPSRIFAALLNRGRAGLSQLAQYTSLTPKQLRHGLAVLLQYDLLFFYVSGPDRTTVYDANPSAAYNLLRSGKVLEMVESLHGADARDVIQSMFALGHTRIADLKEAYKAQINKADATKNGANGTNGHTNGNHADGHTNGGTPHNESDSRARQPAAIRSLEHLNSVLCRLIHAEVLEVVSTASFKSFPDRQSETREMIKTKYFSDGIRGLKKKEEYETRVSEELYNLRDEPRKLKRTLQTNGGGRQKLRKLLNGDKSNGFHSDERDPSLDPKIVLRVNHEKCAVELRNHRLVQAATAAIGETTAQVYGALLRQLTETVTRCRADPLVDIAGGEFYRARAVNTSDIYDNLSPGLDVFTGIGKASADEVDIPTAERLERHAKVDAIVIGDEGGEEEDFDLDDEDYDSEGEIYPPPTAPLQQASTPALNGNHTPNGSNGPANSKPVGGAKGVKFDESAAAPSPPSEELRMQQMRQHLLLLCDNKYKFVRHCDRGTWTVDFEPLFKRLRESELDNAIERKVGRQGLRLARILRDKGKLDEKTLPTMSLMKKSDVQNKMLEMQMHGFVDMQEVPRDNNRSASRTLFLWFCDTPRSIDTLLDNAYKAMVRCLRIRDVHRRENKEVLTFVQRPDVKGREKEALEKKYFDKYQSYVEIEQKLMGQVMRLDSLVGTLRDY